MLDVFGELSNVEGVFPRKVYVTKQWRLWFRIILIVDMQGITLYAKGTSD